MAELELRALCAEARQQAASNFDDVTALAERNLNDAHGGRISGHGRVSKILEDWTIIGRLQNQAKNIGAKNKYNSLKENASTDVFPVERDIMAMNTDTAEADHLLAKQHIWEKFASRLQEWREGESSTASSNSSDMNPDVIVIPKNNTILFEPRTPQAALWLRLRYRLTPETVENNTAIMVHPYQQKQLTAELKAAGFAVSE